MALAPPRRARRSERVSEGIVALIRERQLVPGDLLPTESELMAHMDVGRSSVREALRGLSALGIVEVRQGAGTFVRSPAPLAGPDAADMRTISGALAHGLTEELLEARAIVEVRAAALAARRATASDIAGLERLVESARAASAAGQRGFLIGADFHLAVAGAAHNNVLEGFVASYIPVLAERGAVLERLPGYVEWEVREHTAILAEIANRDARAAAARMRDHLRDMTIHYEHLAVAGLRLPQRRPDRALPDPELADEEALHG